MIDLFSIFRKYIQHQGGFTCNAHELVSCGLVANIIDETISLRPGQGYDSDAARSLRVHHECWRHFLQKFVETTDARVIYYGDCQARLTRHSIGAILGDQQVHISYSLYVAYFVF